ncbi:hypothetical protein SELMODRAFT_431234 [Selaginella moellendorffii]|uniref:F5/8 type C domain-containing protein n=1 Tax=Selaginella moellendorffii TaxID=88036 RepID=D8TBZ0_SELML|nr:hypothetical protein SELMODRAFT_431234 [Selaginella moellendorffii]
MAAAAEIYEEVEEAGGGRGAHGGRGGHGVGGGRGVAGVGRGSLNLAPGGLGHGSEAARGGGAPGGGGHGSTLGGGRRGSSPGGGGHGSSPGGGQASVGGAEATAGGVQAAPGGAQATSGGVDPIRKTSTASSVRSSSFGPKQILDECMETFWAPMQGESTGWIELGLGKVSKFNALEIREPVNMGQRVMEYHVEAWDSELGWYLVSNGSTIGYRKVDRLEEDQVCTAHLVRLLIDASRGDPLICFFGLYFDMYNLRHLSSI